MASKSKVTALVGVEKQQAVTGRSVVDIAQPSSNVHVRTIDGYGDRATRPDVAARSIGGVGNREGVTRGIGLHRPGGRRE